jgi:hypothetical protein
MHSEGTELLVLPPGFALSVLRPPEELCNSTFIGTGTVLSIDALNLAQLGSYLRREALRSWHAPETAPSLRFSRSFLPWLKSKLGGPLLTSEQRELAQLVLEFGVHFSRKLPFA